MPSRVFLLVVGFLTASAASAQSTWSNFTGAGNTLWSTPGNWDVAPTSGIDTSLIFNSSLFQTAAGYTTTADSAFDLNQLTFNSFGSSANPLVVQISGAASTIRFNTSSGGLLPAINLNGPGAVSIPAGGLGLTLNNGTTLNIQGAGLGSLTITAPIVQAGTGNSGVTYNQTGLGGALGTGSLITLAGTNTYAGATTLTSGNLQLNTSAALGTGTFVVNGVNTSVRFGTGTPAIANAITLNQSLNLTGINGATFSGAISGVGGLSIRPTASASFTFTGASSFTGAVGVNPFGNAVSTLTLSGAGAFAGTSGVTLFSNDSLTLDNSGTNVVNRVNSAATLTLNRANLNLLGNATAASSQAFASLAGSGTASFTITPNAAQAASVTFGSWDRTSLPTAVFNATGLGGSGANTGNVFFTANPGGAAGGGGAPGSTNVSVLPYAFGNTAVTGAPVASLVRYNPATGQVIPLSLTTEYRQTLFAGAGSSVTDNVRLASTSTNGNAGGFGALAGPATVNGLVLETNTTAVPSVGVSIGGAGTLNVNGPILASIAGNTSIPTLPSFINAGALNLGAGPGYVHTLANLNIVSPVAGTGGLVKGGLGVLSLLGVNSFSGGLTVNSGSLLYNSNLALGAAGGAINLNGGLTSAFTYQTNGLVANATATTETINRPINLGAAGSQVTNAMSNVTLNFSGPISGSGYFFRVGTGAIVLSNPNNTFTGNLNAFSGITAVQADGSIGANSTVILGGGTFQPLTSFSTTRDFLVAGASTLYTGSGVGLTVTGDIGSQVATNALAHAGAGTLTLTRANSFTGAFTVGDATPTVRLTNNNGSDANGTVTLSGANGALPLIASLALNPGATLNLDNTAAANSNRLGSVTTSLTGGTLNLTGNAGASVGEFIGTSSTAGLNVLGFLNTITLAQPASGGAGLTTTLVATAYAPTTGALAFVRGTNLDQTTGDRGVLLFNTSPAQRSGIIPTMVLASTAAGSPTDFATTVAAGAQFRVTPFTAYAGAIPANGGAAASVFDHAGAVALTGNVAANAVRFQAGSSVDLGTSTLDLSAATSSGTLLFLGSANLTSGVGGTLAAGANSLNIVNNGAVVIGTAAQGAAVTGTNGLTKAGAGTLTLFGTSATTIGNGSGIRVAEGTLALGNSTALGRVTSGTLTNVFPSTAIGAGATLDLSSAVFTGAGNAARFVGINGFGTVALGGSTVQIGATGGTLAGLTGNTSSAFLLGAPQSEATNTFGGGTTTLTGNNAGFSGRVSVLNGTLAVNSNNALGVGTSAVTLGDASGSGRGQLTFGPAVTSFTRDIVIAAGSTTTTPHTINQTASATTGSNLVLSGNVSLGQTLQLSTSGAPTAGLGSLTFAGTVSGAGGMLLFNGNVALSGNNTFSGGFQLDANPNLIVGLGSSSTATTGPLGTGPVTFTSFGGGLRADGGAQTLNNPISTTATTTSFSVVGDNNLTFGGTFNYSTLTSALALNVTNRGLTTFNGVVSGTQPINKNGPGTVVFGAANTYTGATTVNAGGLRANNTAGSATGTGTVTVNAGALLGGTGFVVPQLASQAANLVTINGGVFSGGAGVINGASGTLTIGNASSLATVTQTGGAMDFYQNTTLPLTLAAFNSGLSATAGTGNNLISINGSYALASGGSFTYRLFGDASAFNQAGTYSFRILDATTGLSFTDITVPAQFDVAGLANYNPANLSFSLNANGNSIYLNVTSVPEPSTLLALFAGAGALAVAARRRRAAR